MTTPFRPENPFAPKPPTTAPAAPQAPVPPPNGSFRTGNPFAPKAVDPLAGVLSASLADASTGTPDAAAEAFALAKRTGLPVGTARRNLDEARRIAGTSDFDLDAFLKLAPATSAYLASPDNAHVAHDDLTPLADLEQIGRGERPGAVASLAALRERFQNQMAPRDATMPTRDQSRGRMLLEAEYLNRGVLQVETGLSWFNTTPEQRRNPAVMAQIEALMAERDRELEQGRGLRAMTTGTAEIAPGMAYAAAGAATGAATGAMIGASVAAVGGPFAAGVAGGITATAGAEAGVWWASMQLEGGQAIEQYSKIPGMDPVRADTYGRLAGLLSGWTEIAPLKILAGPWGRAYKQFVRAAIPRVLETPTLRKALTRAALEYGKGLGAEVLQEDVQQGVQLLGEQLLRERQTQATGQDFGNVGMERAGRELWDTAVQTAISMAIIPLPGAGVSIATDMVQVAQAKQNQAFMEAMGESAKASKLRERAPEQFRDFLEQAIAKDGPVRTVSIDVDAWDAGWQANGMDPAEVARQGLSDPSAYLQARQATGGAVVIPLADYVANFAGTEHHQWLMPDLQLRPGELTLREAEAAETRIDAHQQALETEVAEAAKAAAEDPAVAEVYAGYLRLIQQANAADMTPEKAAETASALTGVLMVMGKRANRDPVQLWRDRNIATVDAAVGEPLYDAVKALQAAHKAGAPVEEIDRLNAEISRLRGTAQSGAAAAMTQAQPLTPAELERYRASEAHRLRAEEPGSTSADFALELGVPVEAIDRYLAAPEPILTPDERRGIELRAGMVGSPLEQAALPATVMIAGVERPTANSNGQPIHPTARGVRNFWAWFGDSRVVDKQGRPIVVYHGTGRNLADGADLKFAEFERNLMDHGFGWFAANRLHAGMYDEGHTFSVYLRFQNPVTLPVADTARTVKGWFAAFRKAGVDTAQMEAKPWDGFAGDGGAVQFWELIENNYGRNNILEELRRQGFDGIVAPEEQTFPGRNYLALRNDQAKSLENTGTFGPVPNIMEQSATIREGTNPSELKGMSPQGLRALGERVHDAGYDRADAMRPVTTSRDQGSRGASQFDKMSDYTFADWLLDNQRALPVSFDAMLKAYTKEAKLSGVTGKNFREGALAALQSARADFYEQAAQLASDAATALRAQAAQSQLDAAASLLEQAAYHGTPHVWAPEPGHPFGRVRADKVSTGEGAASFGWGVLYAAENEGVAKGYWERLSKDVRSFDALSEADNVAVRGFNRLMFDKSEGGTTLSERPAAALEILAKAEKEAASAREVADLRNADAANQAHRDKHAAQTEASVAALRRLIAGGDFSVSAKKSGALYRVDISDAAVATFLDWDKPIDSRMLAALRKALPADVIEAIEENINVPFEDIPGSEAYQMIERYASENALPGDDVSVTREDEATSKYLLREGIRGIKYLDAGSRGTSFTHFYVQQSGDVFGAVAEGNGVKLIGEYATREEAEAAGRKFIEEDVGTRNLVVFDEDDVTITHRNGEPVTAAERADILEQGKDKRPNAFILPQLPGVRQTTIAMMNTANVSSIVHEFAHDFLNLWQELATAPDATPGILADWAVIKADLGIGTDAIIPVAAHEKWARGLERYLQDGKAPTQQHARAFGRFRVWFLTIYQRAKELLVPISPELRGVFDRMFATEEAIAAETADAATGPLFATAEEGGMSDAEFAAYRQDHEDAIERSKASLLARLLAEQNRDRTDAWNEKKAEIEAKVTAQVDAEPVQVAVHFLRTGELLTNPDAPKVGEPRKLERALLTDRYGDGLVSSLPTGMVQDGGGADPDIFGLSFGFESGDALIAALQTYEPRKARIARLTKEALAREFPETMNDSPALARAAQDALHGTESERQIVHELKMLGRSNAAIPPTKVPALRALAEATIARAPGWSLSPQRFLQAERKNARLAMEAKATDPAKAAFYQRQRLINHMLYAAAVEAQAAEAKTLKFFGRMNTTAMRAKLGLAGPEYLEAMDTLLERYEFKKVSTKKLERRASLLAWLDRMAGADGSAPIPVEIPEHVLRDAARTNYRELTVEELAGVLATGQQIHGTALFKDKLLASAKKRSMEELEESLVASIEKHHAIEVHAPDYVPSTLTKAKEWLAKVHAWHLKPEFFLRWLDGDRVMGPVHQAIFQPIADAESAELTRVAAAHQRLEELAARVPAELRKGYTTKTIPAPAGAKVKRMSRGTVLALLRNWGSESNREALLAGRVDGSGEGIWTARSIEALFATLTRAEVDMVQAEWDFINEFWPEIAKLQQDMTGLPPQKVEASPVMVTIANGEVVSLRGGYFPLVYDGKYSAKTEKDQAKMAVQDLAATTYTRAATKHGFTEARVGSGGRPVKLDLSILTEHVLAVIHDLTHRRAIVDVSRLIERPAVQNAITGAAGKQLYSSLKPWLVRVANDQQPPASPYEAVIGRARTGATVVNMGWKVTTAIVQPMGYLQTVDLVGPKYAARGLQQFLAHPVDSWEFANEHSAMMQNRMHSFDRDVRDLWKSLEAKGALTRIQQSFFLFTAGTDKTVAVASWTAGYLQSMETLAPGDHARAVQYADGVVRQSQGSGSAKDLARIQGGPETQRMFTMFYSYFSVLYALGHRSGANLKRVGVKGTPAAAASMLLLWVLPSLLSEIVAGRGPGEDDDKTEWALWELMRYPLASVVGLRDIASAIGPDAYTYDLSPVVEAFRTTVEGVGAVTIHLGEGDAGFSDAEKKDILNTVGYWAKLPTRQAWITLDYLYDWMMGYEEPESALEVTRNLAFPRRN